MLGSNILEITEDWEYEKVKSYLLSQSAGFKILKNKLLIKYGLDKLSKKARKNKLIHVSLPGLDSPLKKDFETILSKLRINNVMLENLLSDWDDYTGYDYPSLPFYASISGESLPEGFYIRVDPHTRRDTVIKTYKYIKDEYEHLNKHPSRVGPEIKISKRDKKPDDLKRKIKFYIIVEETILDKLKDAKELSKDEYLQSLINDSIKFAGEKVFKNKKDDFQFFKDKYYSIQTYYAIPTYTQFSELLISLSL